MLPDEEEEQPRKPEPASSAVPAPGPAADAPSPPPAPPSLLTPTSTVMPAGKTAAQLFAEAREKAAAALATTAGRPAVDKYFGSKLPPVCKQLGCYVTDDGKFFYCINPDCHKDRKRETKYNRRRRSLVYFFCPKCKSREIQLHLKLNSYECLDCAYSWKQ